jgi:hypothetical protein
VKVRILKLRGPITVTVVPVSDAREGGRGREEGEESMEGKIREEGGKEGGSGTERRERSEEEVRVGTWRQSWRAGSAWYSRGLAR